MSSYKGVRVFYPSTRIAIDQVFFAIFLTLYLLKLITVGTGFKKFVKGMRRALEAFVLVYNCKLTILTCLYTI